LLRAQKKPVQDDALVENTLTAFYVEDKKYRTPIFDHYTLKYCIATDDEAAAT
jgi:hypothetical protein